MSDDFGFWDVFFSVFWFMLLVAWIWVIIAIIHDIFSDRSLNGGAKALWTIFVVLIPWLGILVYIFARGDSMNDRGHQAALDNQTRPHRPGQPARLCPGGRQTERRRRAAEGWPSSTTGSPHHR